jgi:hypothetical protein
MTQAPRVAPRVDLGAHMNTPYSHGHVPLLDANHVLYDTIDFESDFFHGSFVELRAQTLRLV